MPMKVGAIYYYITSIWKIVYSERLVFLGGVYKVSICQISPDLLIVSSLTIFKPFLTFRMVVRVIVKSNHSKSVHVIF